MQEKLENIIPDNFKGNVKEGKVHSFDMNFNAVVVFGLVDLNAALS
jgi:hypothetical protein